MVCGAFLFSGIPIFIPESCLLFISGLSARHQERIRKMNELFDAFTRKLSDFDSAKDYLYIRAVNYDRSRKRIESTFYRRYSDIALVLYMKGPDSPTGFFTAAIPSSIAASWTVPLDTVWDQAMKNTFLLSPPRYYNFIRCLNDPSYPGEDFMDPDSFQGFSSDMNAVCITSEHKTGGAVSVFLPGVAKRIRDLLGEDFLIVFTSAHEAMIHPLYSVEPSALKEILKNMVEDGTIPEEDFLSNHVFRYDSDTDDIRNVL